MSKIILFSTYYKTDYHKSILSSLIDMCLLRGYKIQFPKDIKSNFKHDIRKENIVEQDRYFNDEASVCAMIAFGKEGYRQIKRFRQPNIPFIYLLCSSDILSDYLYDHLLFDRMILITDKKLYQSILFPLEYSDYLPRPFKPIDSYHSNTLKDNINILVSTDDITLLKILSVLNNHGEYNFTVLCQRPQIFSKMINSNIILLRHRGNERTEYIKNASFVIGNGDFIIESIQYGKPSIVVGRYGFGRQVTIDNIEEHFMFNFQGRLGANSEEVIPFHLLSYEITDLVTNLGLKIKENITLLKSIENISNSLFSIFERNINFDLSVQNVVTESLIKLGSQFWLTNIGNEDYYLIDNRTMKVYAQITDDEYLILKAFEEMKTMGSVLNSVKANAHSKFKRIIEHLIEHKILFCHGKTDN